MAFNLFNILLNSLITFAQTLGYWGIILVMAIESSIFPLPSEIILIPAGILIAQGKFNFTLVIASTIFGSIFGALISYFAAYFGGRKLTNRIFLKYEKIFWISKENLYRTESFFHKYGDISVFLARLLPIVRHLISIPAGFAKMNLLKFSLYTGLGSGIYSFAVIYISYKFGQNRQAVEQNIGVFTIDILIFVGITILSVIIRKIAKKRTQQKRLPKSYL